MSSHGRPDPALESLHEAGRRRSYPKGSLLFAEGDVAHEVLLVLDGSVKILMTSVSGREVVLDVVEAGHLLGELSAIDAGPRSATAVALTKVDVLAIEHRAFIDRMLVDTRLSLHLLQTLAERVRGASRRQLEFGSNDALGRVCQRVLDLVQRSGSPRSAGGLVITVPMSQQDLAAWAGLSREAVVKGLHTMRSLGWISTTGRQVEILDHDAITRRAQM